MILVLLGIGGVLLAVPGLVLTTPRALAAAQRAKTITAFLLLGAAAFEVALLLLGAPTVLRTIDHTAFASACTTVIDRLAPGGTTVGWLAASLAAFIAINAVRATVRARRQTRAARVEPCLGIHVDHGLFDLVIVPTERLVAVGVPGTRPQVVLSEGLVRTLTSQEVQAVIRHEAAHHALGHHRYLLAASVLERTLGRLPLVRRSATTLRNALEHWADDAAAATADSASLELRDAIVGVACAKATREVPAVGRRSRVIDRADRLGRSARPRTRAAPTLVYTAIATTAAATLALVVDWLTTAHHALALSGYCPT